MEINTLTSNIFQIHVTDTISTIEDSDKIVNEIKNCIETDSSKEIQLVIEDSYIMLSRLIGNLLKIIKKDGTKVTVFAGEDNLITLLGKLGLKEVFNVKKYKK